MPITRKEFASAVQRALPQAKVFWKVEPDFNYPGNPCALTATDKINPEKTFTMDLPKGIGQEPLDDVVEDFVRYFNNDSYERS